MSTNATLNSSNNVEGLRVVGDLWQNYGGVYGDYCVLINIATIVLLNILRVANWLPWLQNSLSSWLLSSAKLEWDGLALWQTGSMATHHQYLVIFCVFGAARRRYSMWNWESSPKDSANMTATWYAALERMLARARSYTLLVVIFSQYDGISRGCLATGTMMLVVSRAYEVYYPWLVSIHSQQTCGEQMRRAMVDLQRNVLLDDSALCTDVPWSAVPNFFNATHTRLAAFRAHISTNYGIFMPSANLPAAADHVNDHAGRSSSLDHQFTNGWVDGSCLLTTFSILNALACCWGVVTATPSSPFTWRLAGGFLYLLCFCGMLLLNVPSFIYHLSKLAETVITVEYDRLIYSQVWWSETKRFLGVLVTNGLPCQQQISVLGCGSELCFSSVLGRLEGLECAVYVLLAAFVKLSIEALLCGALLLLKRLGLGHPFLQLCMWLRSQIVTRLLLMMRVLFPGLTNSVAITILQAETALASHKACQCSGLCVQTLEVGDDLFTRLESIVQDKGAIKEPCSFFRSTRAAANVLETAQVTSQLRYPFLARAVALGLLQQAGCRLDKLKRNRNAAGGASLLRGVVRLVRVYAMDSYVPNEETREAMLGAARVVQEVVEEALEAHWQRYKGRERSLEASFCECVSEVEWCIMAAQGSVELLLAYMGVRMSSLEWPYSQLEARVLKDWITTRSTLTHANAQLLLVGH